MAKSLADVKFIDLLPPSISGDPTIRAAAEALDSVLAKTTANIELINIWSRIDELEEPLLSTLAWELHVDYWNPAWPNSAKRATIKKAYILHMRKGTPAAVEEAVKAAVGAGAVEEWFDYAGDPGHFKVHVDLVTSGADANSWDEMTRLINEYKNTRSWLDALLVYLTAYGSRVLATTLLSGETVTVYPYAITELEQVGTINYATTFHAVETVTVYPQAA